MSESGRSRPPGSRRVGDETRQRIDDLADGWSVEPKATPPPPPEPDTERVPLDELDTVKQAPVAPRPTPPAPPARTKPISRPPPIPKSKPPAPALPTPLRVDANRAGHEPTDPHAADSTILQIDAPGPTARATPGTRARELVAVPRERGVVGDMRYVFAAMFGVAQARGELAEIERKLEVERTERDRRLIALARYAVGEIAYGQPPVEQAREALVAIEDQRSRHAGAVAAAEEEIASLRKKRASAHEAYEAEDKRYATELQAIATKLGPLEKSAIEVRKKVAALKVTVDALDKRVKGEERKLVAVSKKNDPVAVEANLASVRAEREAVVHDEPALAAELDEIEPKIAGLTGSRAEIDKTLAAARDRENTEAERTAERIKAAEARQQVEENAVADTDTERDAALLELGERLYVDRPGDIGDKLRGAEEHAVAIATLERKQIELTELVEGVDKPALLRGILYWVTALGAVGAVVYFAVIRG